MAGDRLQGREDRGQGGKRSKPTGNRPWACWLLWTRFLPADPDLAWAGRLDLGQVDGQHAVLALGLDARAVDRLVDLEDSIEIALLIFPQVELLGTLTRLHVAVQDQ